METNRDRNDCVVFVTGAAGFIGGHAVEAFVADGWRVAAMIHRRRSARLDVLAERGDVTVVQGDAGEKESLDCCIEAVRLRTGAPPVIVHCAGRASDVGRDRRFRHANLQSVRHLCEAVRQGRARRLVFVSTTDVYGLLDHSCADEDTTPLRAVPDNPYPRYKILAEQWIRERLDPRQWCIVRPAAVWGPNDPTITRRVISFLRKSPFIVHFGHWRGQNRWPLAHVRNVAAALVLGAELESTSGLAINVLDSERTTADEFYRIIAACFLPGKRFRTITLPFRLARPFAAAVSAVSTLLDLAHPICDPSLYALYSVSRNLDFSNARWLELMAAAGRRPVTRAEGIDELRGRC